jgi:uncharacterized protein YceK
MLFFPLRFFPPLRRLIVLLSLCLCLMLSGCEWVIPNTSNALSQSRQQEALQQQTEQLQRQADALEAIAEQLN